MPICDEFDLIKRYFSPLAQSYSGALGLTDDAAFLSPSSNMEMVMTTDMLVAGVHFFSDDPPASIARKLIRTNLSDLAAKAATPVAVLLGLALPHQTSEQWIKEFSKGLQEDLLEFSCSLIGGDTVSTDGSLTLSLTALGQFPAQRPRLLRSTAMIGDDIWVSGTLGDAAWGLEIAQGKWKDLQKNKRDFLLNRYRIPQPRLQLCDSLRDYARASMDISDGFLQDLNHICEASQVGAMIQINSLPLSEAGKDILSRDPQQINTPLTGGDDYEILFTADQSYRVTLQERSAVKSIYLTRIGRIVEGKEIELWDGDLLLSLPKHGGWRHFVT